MNYTIKKIISLGLTLIAVSIFTFIAFEIIPGDSALNLVGMEGSQEELESIREELGYNKSIPRRYFSWISNAVKGDFGESVQYKMKVGDLIKDRMIITISLGLMSFFLIIIFSLPLGVLAARQRDGFVDKIIISVSQIAMAIPPFFMGVIITLVFGFVFRWFSPGGYISPKIDFGGFIGFMIYPAVAVAIPKIAMLVQLLRASIVREMDLAYVRTARSKGNKEKDIMYGHILKNALIPVITLLGMVLAEILAGTLIIEQVFNLPGLGRLLIVSISNRDYNVVQGIIIYIVIIVVVINFAVDILYQWIDPRVSGK